MFSSLVNIPHVKLVLAVGESDGIHGHQTGLLPATAVLSHLEKVGKAPSMEYIESNKLLSEFDFGFSWTATFELWIA